MDVRAPSPDQSPAELMAAFLPQTLRLIATAFLSVWAGFYMMHLLGWAMGRHAAELPAPPS